MWYSVHKDNSYSFELQRGALSDSPTVEQTIGGFLLSGLTNVELLKSILRRIGLTAAVGYFEAHVAASDNVRIGDFGEVLAGHLLEDAEGVKRLIEKLRYRESPNWPMKLTDVFCVNVEDGRIVGFLFGEAKAGTTTPNVSLGRQAYDRLYKDMEDEEPQILFFTLDRLANEDNQTEYLQLEEAMHRTPPVSRGLRIIFVFDQRVWRDDILEAIHDDFDAGDLTLAEDFKCYVLTRDGLKDVITEAYAEAERMVADG